MDYKEKLLLVAGQVYAAKLGYFYSEPPDKVRMILMKESIEDAQWLMKKVEDFANG